MKKRFLNLNSFCLNLGLATIALFSALPAMAEFNIEPIVGYEHTQQLLPTKHSVNRMSYGARLSAGILFFSLEGEYLRGTIDETYPGFTMSSIGDSVKLGIRSGFGVGSLLRFYLRAGGQASQETTKTTIGGVTTTSYDPVNYAPYGGMGVRLKLAGKFYANVDVVAVIKDINNLNSSSYQTTAGFTVRLP